MIRKIVEKLKYVYSRNELLFWDIIRVIVLICLSYLEYVRTRWVYNAQSPSHVWLTAGCLAICILLFGIGCFCRDKHDNPFFERPNKELAKRLFENVAGGRWITFILLLFFLIQLELIYSNVTEIFYSSENSTCVSLRCIGVNLIAIVFSLFLYPRNVVSGKSADQRELMISGLSSSKPNANGNVTLSFRNIDLLLKPIASGKFKSLKKVIVLPSAPINSFKLDISDDSKAEFKKLFKDKTTDTDKIYENMCNELNELPFNLNNVAKKFMPYLNNTCDTKSIEFDVREPVDYDSYPDCVNRIDDILKNERKQSGYSTDDTLLYINPGTGVIGSALSAFAIPGTRQIVYTAQIDKSKGIMVFDVAPEGLSGIYSEIATQKSV